MWYVLACELYILQDRIFQMEYFTQPNETLVKCNSTVRDVN